MLKPQGGFAWAKGPVPMNTVFINNLAGRNRFPDYH